MNIKHTNQVGVDRLKILVYGPAGSGKTRLARTTGDLEHTLIISAEAGLLSLRGETIAYTTLEDPDHPDRSPMDVLRATYVELRRSAEWSWVILDSITEIAEVCLAEEKKSSKDGRAAYGEMQDRMTKLIKLFRDLPCHVVMTCKAGQVEDDGAILNGPSMPGRTLTQGIDYLFDEVFALRVKTDPDGNVKRALQTQRDGRYAAKDRSGALRLFEPADLSAIATKIRGTSPAADEFPPREADAA